MIAWTLFCGLGGATPQKNDLHWRNAILHDLINYPWPVHYTDGLDSTLNYYFAFWIIPALLGKAALHLFGANAAWLVANISYSFYCVIFLCAVVLLLVSYLKSTSIKRVLFVVGILIFFSGLDIIPLILAQADQENISIGKHLEWWTWLQYSSNTTQLGWVFNQAIPAWLVTALLFHEKRMNHYAYLGLLLLPFGPIPFVGVFFIMVIQALMSFTAALRGKELRGLIGEIFTVPNIVAMLGILPIYWLFYFTNTAASTGGFGTNIFSPVVYLPFVIFEFALYAILILPGSARERFFMSAVLGLFIVPLFTLGEGPDFCMRASIPMLFALMVYVTRYLLNNIEFVDCERLIIDKTSALLLLLLIIGAVTPLTEFRETYRQIDYSINNHTSFYADKFGTLDDGDMPRDNFITINSTDTMFYQYLAK